MILIILITIYILSVIGAYKFIQTAYSTDGIWSSLSPSQSDVFIMLCPMTSTLAAIDYLLGKSKKCTLIKQNRVKSLNKFFRIKK